MSGPGLRTQRRRIFSPNFFAISIPRKCPHFLLAASPALQHIRRDLNLEPLNPWKIYEKHKFSDAETDC